MNHSLIIQELSNNKTVFEHLLDSPQKEFIHWRQNKEKWNLLEIVCHMHDEECEDFRARTKHVLETPNEPLIPINPAGWIKEHAYDKEDYAYRLDQFLLEREKSINWLQSLTNPKWDNAYPHAEFGPMTAQMFLSNWLAHDYLHIRQIQKLKFDYLSQVSGENLEYAGKW